MQQQLISSWLKLDNKKHLRALKLYWETGKWPKGFIPKDVVEDEGWVSVIETTNPGIVTQFGEFHADKETHNGGKVGYVKNKRFNKRFDMEFNRWKDYD